MLDIPVENAYGEKSKERINFMPDKCPSCNKHCEPVFVTAFKPEGHSKSIQAVFRCTNRICSRLFTAYYKESDIPGTGHSYNLINTHFLQYTNEREFSENIKKISPNFCSIFREAETAELNGLNLICGVGYRKSLEFLIKDYIIEKIVSNPEDQEKVKRKNLGPCIDEFIDEPIIKEAAIRAAWLGNDETHYYRKWENQDITDLKLLIDMTLNWIELTLNHQYYMESMPEK